MGVPGFAADYFCSGWHHGLTTCILYCSPLFGNIDLHNNCFVSLAQLKMIFIVSASVYTYINTYILKYCDISIPVLICLNETSQIVIYFCQEPINSFCQRICLHSFYQLDMSTARRCLKSPRSVYGTSAHPIMVTQVNIMVMNGWLTSFLFKGLRPVLEGFVVTMHEGACETGSQIPRALARGR